MKTITLRLDIPDNTDLDGMDHAVIVGTIRDALRTDPAFNSLCSTILASYEVRIAWESETVKNSVAVYTPMEVDV